MKFIVMAVGALLAGIPSSCERDLNKGLQEEKSYSRVAMEKYRQDPKVFRGAFPGVLDNWSRMDYVALAVARQNTLGNAAATTTDKLNFLQPKIQRDTAGKPFCVIRQKEEIVVLRMLSDSVNCSTELTASVDTSRIHSGNMEFSGRNDYWVYVLRPSQDKSKSDHQSGE